LPISAWAKSTITAATPRSAPLRRWMLSYSYPLTSNASSITFPVRPKKITYPIVAAMS
jgi:hypothetical protein